MVRRSPYPAGPLAFVAFGLFVITWAAVRLWDDGTSRQAAPAGEVVDVPVASVPQPPAVTSDHVAISAATNSAPEPELAAPSAAAPTARSAAAQALEELATLAALADFAPPIATRVEFDPVVTLEPEIDLPVTLPRLASSAARLPELAGPAIRSDDGAEPSLARMDLQRTAQPDRDWPYPTVLVTMLQQLAGHRATAAWSVDVLAAIDDLFATDGLASPAARQQLQRLERLSDQAKQINLAQASAVERTLMARASFGLMRRLIVWRHVQDLAASPHPVSHLSADESRRLAQLVARVDAHFQPAPSWREYLLLGEIRSALSSSTAEERGELARRVLDRLQSPALAPDQKKLMSRPPVTDLAAALRPWAAEGADLCRLLDALEQLEVGDASSASNIVAATYQRLRHSTNPQAVELAQDLDTYYRNANVRVVVSDVLLNMLLPHPQRTQEAVYDEVLGARVQGRSMTSARLRLVLLPDTRRLKFGLEAMGQVESSTAATKGPATFYSDGSSRYHARKMVSIGPNGMRVWRSQADVNTDSWLRNLETDYDSLPLVNLFARAVAKQQHDDNYEAARWEVRGKVAARAESRFDAEVHRQLIEAERTFLNQIYYPLERLQLEPTALDLRTTERYLTARYRIAADHQVAAFTPRPRAPSGSLFNIQVHQSTLNNVLEQLKLDGRQVGLTTLYQELARTFNQPVDQEMLAELPDDVLVRFAERDAVRLYCDQGRMLLVIKLAELSQGSQRHWKHFTVRGYYTPVTDKLSARLERDGTIELIGERLNFRDQIALRGIFTKVMSKNRALPVVGEKVASDPRLQTLVVDQFLIQDGWIGLSLGRRKVDRGSVAGVK